MNDTNDNNNQNENSENNKYLMDRFVRFFSLIRRDMISSKMNKFFGGVNPHQGQGRILSILKMKPECTQKELAYILDIRNQSLGELLSKLEKAGYIERTPSETDRRAIDIKLTPKGFEAADHAGTQRSEFDKIFDVLNDEEQEKLKEYLDRLIVSLEESFDDKDENRPNIRDFDDMFGGNFDKIHEHFKNHRGRFHGFPPFPDFHDHHGQHHHHNRRPDEPDIFDTDDENNENNE